MFQLFVTYLPTQNLLSDAKVLENVLKDFVAGDFAAGDFGKVADAVAKILGNEVSGKVVGKGLLSSPDILDCERQGLMMACIGYNDVILADMWNLCLEDKGIGKQLQACSGLAADVDVLIHDLTVIQV